METLYQVARILALAVLNYRHFNCEKAPSSSLQRDMKKNSLVYLRMLRAMSPGQRLQKAFGLSEFSKQLFIHGLRKRFAGTSEEKLQEIVRERLNKCHNRNY